MSHQLPELVGSLGAKPTLCVSLKVTPAMVVAEGPGKNQPALGVGGMSDVVFASSYIGGLTHPGASSWGTGIQGPSMGQRVSEPSHWSGPSCMGGHAVTRDLLVLLRDEQDEAVIVCVSAPCVCL